MEGLRRLAFESSPRVHCIGDSVHNLGRKLVSAIAFKLQVRPVRHGVGGSPHELGHQPVSPIALTLEVRAVTARNGIELGELCL